MSSHGSTLRGGSLPAPRRIVSKALVEKKRRGAGGAVRFFDSVSVPARRPHVPLVTPPARGLPSGPPPSSALLGRRSVSLLQRTSQAMPPRPLPGACASCSCVNARSDLAPSRRRQGDGCKTKGSGEVGSALGPRTRLCGHSCAAAAQMVWRRQSAPAIRL